MLYLNRYFIIKKIFDIWLIKLVGYICVFLCVINNRIIRDIDVLYDIIVSEKKFVVFDIKIVISFVSFCVFVFKI